MSNQSMDVLQEEFDSKVVLQTVVPKQEVKYTKGGDDKREDLQLQPPALCLLYTKNHSK